MDLFEQTKPLLCIRRSCSQREEKEIVHQNSNKRGERRRWSLYVGTETCEEGKNNRSLQLTSSLVYRSLFNLTASNFSNRTEVQCFHCWQKILNLELIEDP